MPLFLPIITGQTTNNSDLFTTWGFLHLSIAELLTSELLVSIKRFWQSCEVIEDTDVSTVCTQFQEFWNHCQQISVFKSLWGNSNFCKHLRQKSDSKASKRLSKCPTSIQENLRTSIALVANILFKCFVATFQLETKSFNELPVNLWVKFYDILYFYQRFKIPSHSTKAQTITIMVMPL